MEQKKNKPTESQIEILMSDWLGNLRMDEGGRFTHKGKGGIRRQKHTSLQDYLLGDVSDMDNLDLIKNARMAAENIVNAVAPRPAVVKVGGNQSFQMNDNGTDQINLATDYFDDGQLSKREKVDIMFGLAAHEAAHVAYTEPDLATKNIEKEHPGLQQLKHNIWNILEDERIEYLLGEDRPGVIECIGATKEYYFDRMVNGMKAEGKMPTEPLPKLIAVITQAIRYPSQMTREHVEENFDELDEIRRTLTPYPLSPEDCIEASDRVMDIIRKKAEEEMKKEQEKQEKEQKEKEEKGEQGKNQGGDSSQSKENGDGKKKKKGKKNPTPEEVNQAIIDALSTEQGKKVMDAIKQEIEKAKPQNVSSTVCDSANNDFVNNDDSERIRAGSGTPDTFVKKPKGQADKYNADLKAVRPYIPAMSKALACKSQQMDYVLRSQPKGKLDTNKLVAYMAGSEKIFVKSGSVRCSSASVCMLIDESGSMGQRLKLAARQAAILVNEAVKRIKNVNFYCYGFTTRIINVYSENGKTSPWALSETASISGTPTGEAMQLCAQRIRRFTGDPVLMLVLTDGCPNDGRKVIQQDSELRKKGFIPIGVGILTNAVQGIFQESIVMNSIDQFPVEMGKLTKGKLNKMLVRTDSEA